MRRSVVFLNLALLALAGCSADDKNIDSGGNGNPQCAEGLDCDEDPSMTGDGDTGDGDLGDGDTGDGDTGDGDGDTGDGDMMSGDGDTGGDGDMPPPSVEGECKPEDIVPDGCLESMQSEGANDLCDRLDNDCDGKVDEGCACDVGTVQRCFAGPPGRRKVGGCDDGTQRCEGTEFGYWGPCEGGKLPSDEVCDSLDNDCNGCIDEIEDCKPTLACPGPDDPRVPDGKPFSIYALEGAKFVTNPADVATWKWTVEGTPCDKLFLAQPGSPATPENGQLSYQLNNANQQDASIKLTLSGDYLVTMSVTFKDGTKFECSWVVHVKAPGVRVEMCWDTTGPTAPFDTIPIVGTKIPRPVDVDLHLGKHGKTTEWFASTDCYFSNCVGPENGLDAAYSVESWGYDMSNIAECSGDGARSGFVNACPNPRLDIDNISTTDAYVPENVNVDRPLDGDKFRVMAHYFALGGVEDKQDTHPLVNVYCGGELKGTFGADPNRLTGFRRGGGPGQGDMWRVVDITAQVDGEGVTTDCDLAPLGLNITNSDSTF